MSNQNKPTLSLGSVPPPPLAPPPAAPIAPPVATTALAALPANVAELFGRYPLPWCVGPEGYIWVASDVMKITDPDDRRIGDTADGWRATGNVARLVIEVALPAETAAVILYAVNKLGKA
jgi:hypothetical protein